MGFGLGRSSWTLDQTAGAAARVAGDCASRGDVGLRGDAGFGSLEAGGDAQVALALLVGLSPGQALGLGGDGDCAGVLDQAEGFLDFWFGLGGFGLGCGGDARATGGLEFVQATLGFVGFAAEADGAAAEAEGSGQRHVRGGGLAERFERLKAEADDVGGEPEFVLGFGVVGSEHLGRGFAGRGHVAGGAGEEECRRGWVRMVSRTAAGSVLARDMGGWPWAVVRCLFAAHNRQFFVRMQE